MSRLSRVLLYAVTAFFVTWSGYVTQTSAETQEPLTPSLAIIDVQKILRDSIAVKSLSKEIEAQRGKYQGELREKEKKLRNADQELTRQRSVLTAEAFAKKRKELEQQVTTVQREIQERRKNLDQLFTKGMNQVQNELLKVAKKIAEERDLDLILSKATVVIVKPKFDITNEALRRLNANLPDVALTQSQ